MNLIKSSILILACWSVLAAGTKGEAATTNTNEVAKTNSTVPAPATPPPAAAKEASAPSTNAPMDPANPSSSASLTSEAWQALEKKDYATAKARIEKCRQLYEAKAVEMQAGLTSLPAPDKTHSYWALNDVGTCVFILGKVAEAEGKPKEALRHYQEVVDRFSLSQCWDKQGWFWQPAVAAKERLAALTLETAE
jgi:tetratricopeptide (TPR) repeat protein